MLSSVFCNVCTVLYVYLHIRFKKQQQQKQLLLTLDTFPENVQYLELVLITNNKATPGWL